MASTPSSFAPSSTTTPPPLRTSAPATAPHMDPNAPVGPSLSQPYYHHHPGSSTPAHLYSPPSSVAHSPSSVGSPTSYYHPQHQHAYHQPHHRGHPQYLPYSQKEQPLYMPSDSSPRTFPNPTGYEERLYHQLPSPSSATPSNQARQHYRTYPPLTTSSTHHSRSQSYDDTHPSNTAIGGGRGSGNVSSDMPEYSYPMHTSRMHRELNRSLQHRPQHEHPSHRYGRDSESGNPQERQFLLQPDPRIPSSAHSSRSAGDTLPLRTGPGLSISTRNGDNQLSSATPRSMPMQASIRQSVTDIYSLTESPVDERDASSHRQTILGTTRGYDPYDMESYPEPDDAQESEDEHEDDDGMGNHAKKQKLGASYSRPLPYNNAPFSRNSQYVGIEQNESNIATEQPSNNMGSVEEEHGEEYGNPEMMTGVCTQGISVNAHGDERPQRKTRKPKNTAQKRGSRRTSLPTSHGDPNDQIDGDGHAGIEPPLAGRGLRIYAQRVCEQVKDKGSTSYNELVHDLFGGNLDENVDNAPETTGQENIRRRVYDALNVLNAIDIIRFENKDIRWVGAERSEVIHKVTRSAQGEPPEDGGDDESEEPEDDDMEIDKLQREVDAMRLRNQLEQAKLQDQLTRQVSLLNLVKRNKRREEREARRRQPREERRRTTGDMDASMTDTGAQGASDHNDEARKKSERRRRRQSRRRHLTERPEGQMGETSMVDMEADLEDEEARRRRRQERRERRERKEKQRSERIQLPFVIVRMPGYTSSDSESSISVVRSVKSRKGKQATQSPGQEMTMVEIQIPQQEELGIMSDTEILGELGLNTVTMDELETMLPKDLMDAVQYTINDETPRMDSLRNQRPTEAGHSHRSVNGNPVVAEDDASAAASITVHGGFERQIVRAASESASSVA